MSRQLPTLSPRKVIQALERGGFFVDHVTGSHYRMKHRHDPTRSTVVPYHSKDLKRPLLRAILRQAGLTVDDFLDLLWLWITPAAAGSKLCSSGCSDRRKWVL